MSRLPHVNGRRVVRALEKVGWYVHRRHGSHVIMKNNGKPGARVTIPVHPRPLKPYILSTILKEAELSVEQLNGLL